MTCRSFGVGVVIILGIYLRLWGVSAYPPGYSYSKFTGPVSGPDHEIIVKGEHGEPAIDYVAHPDYRFEYGVEDAKSNVKQSRREARHGDEVIGEYSVVEPDGTVRTVKYKADKENGFQAQVFMDGKLVEHGNTDSGSHESEERSHHVSHNILGSHSMERPTYTSSNTVGRSSSEEAGYNDDDGDNDDVSDEDDED